MLQRAIQHIAVIGSGVAGAACAQTLARAGHAVQVFDKGRGAGGRLATRHLDWVDRQGQAQRTALDHGALAFRAEHADFRHFVAQARQAGCVAEWKPVLAPGSLPLSTSERLVPVPDAPALCHHLLRDVPLAPSFQVDALHRIDGDGDRSGDTEADVDRAGAAHDSRTPRWQLQSAGTRHPTCFDAVVLAVPPAQAATLLGPHHAEWARHAAVTPMQPCWTLMGVAQTSGPAPRWDLARPPTGPIAWVLRPDARPGRQPVPGHAPWVVHARSAWSRRHLEETPAWVQGRLHDALAAWLGQPVDWHCVTVHRWRYALPPLRLESLVMRHWWDAAQGLGVCGDFLGGGSCGVEGAWLSGQSLAAALLAGAAPAEQPLPFASLAVPPGAARPEAPSAAERAPDTGRPRQAA